MLMSQLALPGFEDGRRPTTKGCCWPPESEKRKTTGSPLEPPEEGSPAETIIIAQ